MGGRRRAGDERGEDQKVTQAREDTWSGSVLAGKQYANIGVLQYCTTYTCINYQNFSLFSEKIF